MKIIHTYSEIRGGVIDKRNLYMMTLSLLLINKHYGKTKLYTDKENAKIIKEIGLPYDEIDDTLLNDFKTNTFSIPKLLVYSEQKEPFIHIDLDAFLFYKIDFNKENVIYGSFNEGLNYVSKLNGGFIGFYNTYLHNTFRLLDRLDDEFKDNIYFNEVPNMSVFGGYQNDLISNASRYCLDLYEKNKLFFDNNYYNACIIEQLFIPTAMKMMDKNTTFQFLHDQNKIINIEFGDSNDLNEYPIYIKKGLENLKTIKDDIDLCGTIFNEFYGFLHLFGSKMSNKIISILRGKIILEMKGIKYINKIDEICSENLGIEYDIDYYNDLIKQYNRRRNVI